MLQFAIENGPVEIVSLFPNFPVRYVGPYQRVNHVFREGLEIALHLEMVFDGGTSEDALWLWLRCAVLFKDPRVSQRDGDHPYPPVIKHGWLENPL